MITFDIPIEKQKPQLIKEDLWDLDGYSIIASFLDTGMTFGFYIMCIYMMILIIVVFK